MAIKIRHYQGINVADTKDLIEYIDKKEPSSSVVSDVKFNGNSVVNEDGIANLNLASSNNTISLSLSDKTLNIDSAVARYNTTDDGLSLIVSKKSDSLDIKYAQFSVGSSTYDALYLSSLLTSGSFITSGIFKIPSLDLSTNLVSNSLTITPDYSDYQQGNVKARIELKSSTSVARTKADARAIFNLESGYLATSKASIDNYTCIIENNNLYWNFEASLNTSIGSVGLKLLAKSINASFSDTNGTKWKVDVATSPTTWSYRTGEILWGIGSGSSLVWVPLSTEYKFENTSSPLLSIYLANTANTTGTTSYLRCCFKVPLIKVQ